MKLDQYINMRQSRLQNKQITRDKVGYCMIVNVSIQQEDITISNVNAFNNRVLTCTKQKLKKLKGEMEKPTQLLLKTSMAFSQ